ncbi:MAG: molecular chaperone GrpE [Pyrinomonadaceae bacterium]|jgi:molecular chaperone GrpE|nr:molecular chaperone GrpE [Pyrinomonadaceae bacterium]
MSRFGRGRGAWDEDEPRDIRVTDRRRIHLDDEGESVAPAADVPNLKPSYVEELEARTRAAEQKLQEVQARFEQLRQQLQNETDETRRRLNKAADERAHREKANFITALLPVLDNLQRATEATESGASAEDVAEGVRRTASSFENALVAAGVEPLESVGEQFNPELHEAVETAEVEPQDEGKVIEEYARGYRIGDRLLRPARVKVGRAAARAKGVE